MDIIPFVGGFAAILALIGVLLMLLLSLCCGFDFLLHLAEMIQNKYKHASDWK